MVMRVLGHLEADRDRAEERRRPEPGAGETHPVLAHLGRYGPFLKCGPSTRSIPAEDDVLEIGRRLAVGR